MSSTSVKYLCRVCTGKGLISIESNKLPENLFIQNKFIWQTPVKDMIQLISGEPVDSDDDLPQFICTVCLFYLHHSWELRQNIIKNSLNLRAALELSSDSSADYKAKLKVETATQREIRLDEEESLEEQRLYQLQKMNVDDKLDYNHNRLKGVNCAGK